VICPPTGFCLDVDYVRARDGDTFVFRIPGSAFEWAIRLIDCWVEDNSAADNAATEFADDVLNNAELIRVWIPAPKHRTNLLKNLTFDRILGYVFVESDKTLNEMIVERGWGTTTKPDKRSHGETDMTTQDQKQPKQHEPKENKGRAKGKVKSSDQYDFSLSIESRDVDNDGFLDLVIETRVLRNGDLFVTSQNVWYGLDADDHQQFAQALADAGVKSESFTTDRFRKVVKAWRRAIDALTKISKYGDHVADQMNEPQEA